MKDDLTNSGHNWHTQREWDANELEIIESLAATRTNRKDLLATFPGRTLGAIRNKIYQTRRAMGIALQQAASVAEIEPTMLSPDDPGIYVQDWQEQQRPKLERANAAFLEAMRAAA